MTLLHPNPSAARTELWESPSLVATAVLSPIRPRPRTAIGVIGLAGMETLRAAIPRLGCQDGGMGGMAITVGTVDINLDPILLALRSMQRPRRPDSLTDS